MEDNNKDIKSSMLNLLAHLGTSQWIVQGKSYYNTLTQDTAEQLIQNFCENNNISRFDYSILLIPDDIFTMEGNVIISVVWFFNEELYYILNYDLGHHRFIDRSILSSMYLKGEEL